MSPGSRAVAVALLCALVFAQAWTSLRHKSLTFDEVVYIPAGYSYVVTGDYRLNPEHPPLAKLLSGIALLPLRPRLDTSDPAWEAADQWTFGRHFFEGQPGDIGAIVSAARLPIVLLTMLLIVGAYALARDLYGPHAGLFSAWLCTFSPDLLAHGRLATNDLALAAFVLLTVHATRRLLARPTAAAVAVAGGVLGLALLTKYTAVLLLALLPVWVVADIIRDKTPLAAPSRRTAGDVLRALAPTAGRLLGVVLVAAAVVSLGYRTPGRIGAYVAGLGVLYTNVNLGIPTYFHGTFHPDGVPYYFVAAFLLKTPSAFLALLLLRVGDQAARRDADPDGALYLILPSLLWLAVISATALQFGVRYILPIYPLLFVHASGLLASPTFRHRAVRVGVGALAVAFAAGSLRAHPDYLPYFNVLAGGPARGIEWLDDSNVDWGQDLPLLAEYLRARGIEDATVAPMGWYDPALYGVVGRVVGPGEMLRLLADPDAPHGVYAVSAHLLTRGRFDPSAAIDPLSDLAPVAILGHSLYVFER